MTRKEFQKLAEEALRSVPREILRKMDNVDIVVEDDCPAGEEPLLGMYEGVPKTERENYGQVLPDKITLFRKQIEKEALAAGGKGEAIKERTKEIIKETIWHEIAHHFGMGEAMARKMEGKGKRREK